MCQSIEKVFQLATAAFSKKTAPESVKKNIEILLSHTNKLTRGDVGLEYCHALQASNSSPYSAMDSPGGPRERHKAPVTYIPVSETMDISMGIFVIGEGETIPLHDHPHMHGVIKCLAGNLKITSFTKKDPPVGPNSKSLPDRFRRSPQLLEKIRLGELFLAEQLDPCLYLSPDSGSCLLEPLKANIHRIESVGGPAAFLDILAPPYNIDPAPQSPDKQERDCHYFRELPDPGPSSSARWLLLSNPPVEFYCDTELYRGPEIREG